MGARVLIADDNPDALLTLEALLDSEGYEVRAVKNGIEVLPALREPSLECGASPPSGVIACCPGGET